MERKKRSLITTSLKDPPCLLHFVLLPRTSPCLGVGPGSTTVNSPVEAVAFTRVRAPVQLIGFPQGGGEDYTRVFASIVHAVLN